MSKSLYDIHILYVEELKKRGEKIVHCLDHGETDGHFIDISERNDRVLGYDKTAGYKTAGYIYRDEDGSGEFELHQDHLTRIVPVKWTDIGLCDARCWYKEQEKQVEKKVPYRALFHTGGKYLIVDMESHIKIIDMATIKEVADIKDWDIKKLCSACATSIDKTIEDIMSQKQEKQAEPFTICCEICNTPIFNLPDLEKDTLAKSANDYKVFCTPCFERRYL